jgi:MFS family permease
MREHLSSWTGMEARTLRIHLTGQPILQIALQQLIFRRTSKKCFLTICVIVLTFSVYIGSSVWAPAAFQGADYFDVSLTASALGIALFVLGYGTGPLLLAPVTEIPAVGRTAPYIITLLIYALLQIPQALVTNFAGFCVLRFLSGFVGSPVLATGGKLCDVNGGLMI